MGDGSRSFTDPSQHHHCPEKLDLYASCGPEITAVTLQDGRVDVTCSPVQRVIFASDNHRADCAHGDGLTSASFDLGDDLPAFLRIIIIDAQGRPAWTNAVWLDHTR